MGVRKALTLGYRLNIPALLAGIIILYIIYKGEPWWILTAVGEIPTFKAEVAPYIINIVILNKLVYAPIITYIILSGYLTYLLVGIATIIGSLMPRKEISKSLIGYRALTIPILSLVTIYIATIFVERVLGIKIPFIGYSTLIYSIPYQGSLIKTTTPMQAFFTDSYYLAIIAGILGVIGKLVAGVKEE